MVFSTSFKGLLLALLLMQRAAAVSVELDIVNTELSPDGFTRDTVVANGIFPGTLITGNKGDNFQINVVNELTDDTMLLSTSIHWHGIFQIDTNWADGPAFVTQCPIAANNSFLYNFDVTDQAGTYWYHSHLSTQYCDGLRGALVIYDPEDPYLDDYDVDDDTTVLTLADWYHYVAPQAPVPAASQATLINGLGRYLNTTTGEANDATLAVVNVEQGKRYRFRVVNIACDPAFTFSIDQHTFTIIEADGVNTEPLIVDIFQIFAAQRYSIILNANQSVDNYWIRALPNSGVTGTVGTTTGNINSAILRYVGAPDEEPNPATPWVPSNPLDEVNLHPLTNAAAPGNPTPGGADVNIPLVLDFTGGQFLINNVTFIPPNVPVLLQILSGTSNPADLLPTGSIYTLPANQVIELEFSGLSGAGGNHPFHLHGHTFSVVRSAGHSTYNWDNPVQRDTVNTGNDGDLVTIRFETDNPGPWFLHCHIDWHLDAGFAVVMAEDTGDVPTDVVPPDAWDSLCPTYNDLTPAQKGGIVPS